MSNSVPPLIFYPLYPGGPQVRATNAWLNANSTFRTTANSFVPAYGVNLPPDLSAYEADTYYTLSGTQAISRRSVNQAKVSTTPFNFDGTVVGGLRQVSPVATAPEVPNVFKAAERLLAVSDLNMTTLLSQDSFRLDNIGLGLKVTSDGLGGVDSVAISPSVYGSRLPLDATAKNFGGLNRAEITTGATFKVTDLSVDTGPGVPALNPALPSPLSAQGALAPKERNAGIFKLQEQALRALQSVDPESAQLTAILNQLEKLEPSAQVNPLPEQPVATVGLLRESQQVAANRAGLGVKTSEGFLANLVGLIQANQQSESYARAFTPRLDQVMNGKIAVSPWVAGQSTNASAQGFGSAASFEMGAAVADAMSRKGRGGSYVPFQQSSQQLFGGDGFAQGNPFMGAGGGTGSGTGFTASGGQAQQQFYRPRKPLAFTA